MDCGALYVTPGPMKTFQPESQRSKINVSVQINVQLYGCGHGIGSNWDQRRCQPLSEDTRTCADKP